MYLQKVTGRKKKIFYLIFVGVFKVNDDNSRIRGSADPDPNLHQNVMASIEAVFVTNKKFKLINVMNATYTVRSVMFSFLNFFYKSCVTSRFPNNN